MSNRHSLKSVRIQGYRPFRDFDAKFGEVEIFVGANGVGKSCLFEFLRFLRDALHQDIPPEIVQGSIGQQVFHVPGPEKFSWSMEVDSGLPVPLLYEGELMGPIGRTHVCFEGVRSTRPLGPQDTNPFTFLNFKEKRGQVYDLKSTGPVTQKIALSRPNQLALCMMTNPTFSTLYDLREYIRSWRFYSSFNIAHEKIRKSVPIEQEPVLHEDAGNLSSLLHYLMTEYRSTFDELQHHLRFAIPGFKSLSVKARGGPGEVIAFWREDGLDSDLSLADLSDGILRFLCWTVLCIQPNPPALICIDEPDQGIHPRSLPLLAGLFGKACERTQVLLATHSSYFLTQFQLSEISVMTKKNGEAVVLKPSDSKVLVSCLEDFGQEEIEAMHRSDQLEIL